jgi:hypothetical protein
MSITSAKSKILFMESKSIFIHEQNREIAWQIFT